MTLQPIDRKLLLLVADQTEIKIGHLFIPPHEHALDDAHERRGVIIAAADDCRHTWTPGQVVCFAPLAGVNLNSNASPDPNQNYVILHEDRVLTILEEKEIYHNV
jgi:hypothetical protein